MLTIITVKNGINVTLSITRATLTRIIFTFCTLSCYHRNKLNAEALKYYELAAYDNDIIVHKDAAFACIVSSDKLLSKNKDNIEYINKHIYYALKYTQQYPTDAVTQELITHAAEVAYQAKDYKTSH